MEQEVQSGDASDIPTSGSYVPAEVDLGELRSPRMRSLIEGLWRLHRGPDRLSVPNLRKHAQIGMSDATLRRYMAAKGAAICRERPEWTGDLIKLERLVEARRRSGRKALLMPRRFDDLLDVEESEIYGPISRQLGISEERLALTRQSAPGWYFGICFSTSLPNHFVFYLVHMKEKRRGVSYLEYQYNITTGTAELYSGFIFGKSESHCIFCIESTQNLIRSYVQTDRLPNRGPISWMKGHVIATGVGHGGFFSPFYLERIQPASSWAPHSKGAEVPVEDVELQMARIIFDEFVDVDPLSKIGAMIRNADMLEALSPDATPDRKIRYEVRKFVGRFAAHAIAHVMELKQEIERSFARLEIQNDHVYRLLASVPR